MYWIKMNLQKFQALHGKFSNQNVYNGIVIALLEILVKIGKETT